MKSRRLLSSTLAALAIASVSHATLVTYEFDGVVNASSLEWAPVGTSMHTVWSFDTNRAVALDPEQAPGSYAFNYDSMRLAVTIGPRTVNQIPNGGFLTYFSPNSVTVPEAIMDDPTITYFSFEGKGTDLFDSLPIHNLNGGKWANLNQGSDIGWYTQSADLQDGLEGPYTRFRLVDARPTPEPSTAMLFGSALAGFAGFRRFRKKSRNS